MYVCMYVNFQLQFRKKYRIHISIEFFRADFHNIYNDLRDE